MPVPRLWRGKKITAKAAFVALGVFFAAYLVYWVVNLGRARRRLPEDDPAVERGAPTPLHLAIGFITNFFDTLGIGSFATTTSMFRLRGVVPDRLIPGTLNVGHTAPTVVQAFIYIAIVARRHDHARGHDRGLVAGAWLWGGGGRAVRGGRSRSGWCGSCVAASLNARHQSASWPVGLEAIVVDGTRLGVGVCGNFVLGALMTRASASTRRA